MFKAENIVRYLKQLKIGIYINNPPMFIQPNIKLLFLQSPR